MSKILNATDLTVFYGTVRALENTSFYVNQNEIVAMIGPNGAGKSTALKAVCGLVPVNKGEVRYQDANILGLTTDTLVEKGLSLVPESRHIFSSMTVLENLEMGAYTLSGRGKSSIKERLDDVFDLFPILKERLKQKAGLLSTGEQQMLAIGRALILKPALLLLDEPSLGLSPNYVEKIFEQLVKINKNGTSLLIVEQNILKALEICHRGYVFEIGAIALEGERDTILKSEKIKEAIL